MKGTLRPVPARVGFIQKSYMMWNLYTCIDNIQSQLQGND